MYFERLDFSSQRLGFKPLEFFTGYIERILRRETLSPKTETTNFRILKLAIAMGCFSSKFVRNSVLHSHQL